jgi:hypothetical protein
MQSAPPALLARVERDASSSSWRSFVPAFKEENECYIKYSNEPILDEMLILKVSRE